MEINEIKKYDNWESSQLRVALLMAEQKLKIMEDKVASINNRFNQLVSERNMLFKKITNMDMPEAPKDVKINLPQKTQNSLPPRPQQMLQPRPMTPQPNPQNVQPLNLPQK